MSSSESSADSPPTKILPCLALAFLGSIFLLFMMWSFEAKTLNKPKVNNHNNNRPIILLSIKTRFKIPKKILFYTNSKHFSGVDILTTYFSSRTGKVFHHLMLAIFNFSSLCDLKCYYVHLNPVSWDLQL